MSTTNGGGQPPAPSFDSLFDEHFGAGDGDFAIDGLGEDTGGGAGSTPADHEDEAPFGDDDDNLDDQDRDGDGSTDDDEWDDEEGGDEEGDDDESDTDPQGGKPQARGRDGKGGAAGGKPDEKGAQFFDRKEIDQIQDPEAKRVAQKAYASMQRAFTQKTTELAEERKGWEAKVHEADEFRSEYNNFAQEIASDDGAEQFLHMVIEARPHVFTESVLVSLALQQPDLFEKAAERFQQLVSDDGAAETFREKVQVGRDKYANKQQDRSRQRQAAATQQQKLEQAITQQATTHGVTDADSLEIIRGQVHLLLQRNRTAQKQTTLAEVNGVVERVAKRLKSNREGGRREGEQRERAKRQDGVREQARRARDRRPAPTGRRTPADRGDYKPPTQRGETSRALVDHFFGD